MNKSPLTYYLQDVAESRAPQAEIDLVAVIHRQYLGRLAARRRRRTALIVAVSLVVLLGAALASPPGQALAKRLFQFFSLADANTLVQPTPDLELLAVSPASPPLATDQRAEPPFAAICGGYASPSCSPQQIQDMVTFSVKVLAEPPEGLSYQGATGGPDAVVLRYGAPQGGGVLFLYEIPWDGPFPAQEVGAGAVVESVPVGDTQGEYVQGAWEKQGDLLAWQPEGATRTLRWAEDGMLYEMLLSGDPGTGGLDSSALAALAASLTGAGTSTPAGTTPSGFVPISQAEETLGRALILPAGVPDGYSLAGAHLAGGEACLYYRYREDDDIAGLRIAERAAGHLVELKADTSLSADAALEEQFVPLGGAEGGLGLYAWGAPQVSALCNPGGDARSQTALVFKARGMTFDIYGPPPEIMTRLEMVRLAEQLTGMETTAGLADPQRILSPEEAQAYLDFPLTLPTLLPRGWYFHHATADPAGDQVTLYYYAGWDAGVYGSFSLREEKTGKATQSAAPGGTAQTVTIGGQEGVLQQGCTVSKPGEEPTWDPACDTQSLAWQADGVAYHMEAGLDPQPAREVLAGVAASLVQASQPSPAGAPPQTLPAGPLLSLPAPYRAGAVQVSLPEGAVCQPIPGVGYFVQRYGPLSFTGAPLRRLPFGPADGGEALAYSLDGQALPGCAGLAISNGIALTWQSQGMAYLLASPGDPDAAGLLKIAEALTAAP